MALQGVENRVEDEERYGGDDGNDDVVAHVGVAIAVQEDVRVKALVLVDPEGAVLCQAEGSVVLAHYVGGEVQRIEDPRNQEDPPASGGQEAHRGWALPSRGERLAERKPILLTEMF